MSSDSNMLGFLESFDVNISLQGSRNQRIKNNHPAVPLVMLEAVKLMAAVCLVPPDGHDKVRLVV